VIRSGIVALTALLVLLLVAPGPPEPATAQQPEDDPPPAAPEEEGAAPESEGEEAEQAEPEGEESAEPPPTEEEEVPEGVRRRRPRTAEQERSYKQRKTREDPFLNPPVDGDPVAGDEQYYDPARRLHNVVHTGISSYVVQDAGGAVIGQLTMSVELVSDPVLGDFVHLRQRSDHEQPQETDLWLYGETLKPRRKEVVIQLPTVSDPPPAVEGEEDGAGAVEVQPLYHDTKRLDVDYLFDRLVIRHRAGGITASRRLRMMPFSYDIDELLLLVRQLRFRDSSWPFEALICDPANEQHLALRIEQPRRVENVLSADAQLTDCYELAVRLGEHQLTYWVQRLPPCKLVKFSDGAYTYTLNAYLE
jgi:hypothetical protein